MGLATVARRADGSDIEDLMVLIREFCEADDHDFDDARVRGALLPILADDSVGQAWVLDDHGSLSGYAIVTWSWSLESGGRDCILDEIYVRESGQGRGALLVERALIAAQEAGARAVFLETEAHNARVRGFYQRHGFTIEDSVWMSAPLPRDRA